MSLRDMLLAPVLSAPILTMPSGETVHSRKLSGIDVMEARSAVPDENPSSADIARFGTRLVLRAACDSAGVRVFADSDQDAVDQMPFDVQIKLIAGIKDHNGMGDEVKNSSTPSKEGS